MTSTPAMGYIEVLPGHPDGDMPEPTPILPPKSRAVDHIDQVMKDSTAHHVKGLSTKNISESLAKNKERSKKSIKVKGISSLFFLMVYGCYNINNIHCNNTNLFIFKQI
jgi:hypothetical protein